MGAVETRATKTIEEMEARATQKIDAMDARAAQMLDAMDALIGEVEAARIKSRMARLEEIARLPVKMEARGASLKARHENDHKEDIPKAHPFKHRNEYRLHRDGETSYVVWDKP